MSFLFAAQIVALCVVISVIVCIAVWWFALKDEHKPNQSWVRLEAPRQVSEEESLEVQMEELEASREWRKVCLLNADMAERRIQELEARLEQPQHGAYRGQIPAQHLPAKRWRRF